MDSFSPPAYGDDKADTLLSVNGRRLLITVLAAMSVALFAGACGGGDDEDPADVLDAALAPGGESVESGVLSLDLDISAGGEEDAGSFKLAMEGPYQGGGEGSLPQFDLEGTLDFEGAGQDISADAGLVSTGGKGYIEYQGAAYELPKSVIQRIAPIFQSAQAQSTAASSEACTAALEEQGVSRSGTLFGDLSNEGESDVEGAETTHITGAFALANLGELVQAGVDVPECVGDLGEDVGPEQVAQLTEQLGQLDTAFQDIELGFYVGDDDLIHGLDVDLGLAQPGGTPATVSLGIRFGDLNEPQTVAAPQNVQPAAELLTSLGLTPELIQQALQQGLGSLGASAGAGTSPVPQAGGSPEPPTSDASQAYLECLQTANDATALQECAALLQP